MKIYGSKTECFLLEFWFGDETRSDGSGLKVGFKVHFYAADKIILVLKYVKRIYGL